MPDRPAQPGIADTEEDSPTTQLLKLLAGKWIVQAVSTAARLGIADELAGEPRTALELARRLDLHAPSLARLLRALVSEGLMTQDSEQRYRLTPMGELLRSGALRDLASFVGTASQWTPWTALAHAVRTGECAFERVHGASLFDHLRDHPAEAALYDDAVDAFTCEQATALAASPELDGARHVVDVGGGRGTLLIELLARRPETRGTLFDRAHVVERSREHLEAAGVADRCDVVAGDFFGVLPGGADVYVVKHVVHNWDDERAATILRRCREAMAPDGRVLVVEAVVLPGNRRDPTRLLDLEMLVLTQGGRERSKPEMRRLFAASGLRLARSQPLGRTARLLVGVRAGASA